jgi:hypothetical protein
MHFIEKIIIYLNFIIVFAIVIIIITAIIIIITTATVVTIVFIITVTENSIDFLLEFNLRRLHRQVPRHRQEYLIQNSHSISHTRVSYSL